MLDSYLEELKSVRAAIVKLTTDPVSSQSVSSANGGSYSATYVDLAKLHAREKELIGIVADLYRGGSSIAYPIYCGGF